MFLSLFYFQIYDILNHLNPTYSLSCKIAEKSGKNAVFLGKNWNIYLSNQVSAKYSKVQTKTMRKSEL